MSSFRDTRASDLLRELRKAGIPVEYISFEDRSKGSYIVIYLYTGDKIKLRTKEKWYLIKTTQLADSIAGLQPQNPRAAEPTEIQEILGRIKGENKCPICGLRIHNPLALALHIYYKHGGKTSNTKKPKV